MCGIAGIYNFNSSVDKGVLSGMTDILAHRGPDARGIFLSEDGRVGLGFRRLAIIDLSDDGNQPMFNEDSSVAVVFNGEIYNFGEIREKLVKAGHIFKSKTDTEVIVHLYEEKGEKCLEDLNGMFAFAVWDEKKKRLFAARDHLGIKPFYYYLDRNKFVFASEIKAILEDPEIKREPDKEGISHYLTFACTPAPFTLFKGIKKLAPANFLTIDREGRVEVSEYWNPVGGVAQNSEDYYVSETISILKDSIEKQMISDVPFGCFLSGGVDSSTNAVLMSKAMGKPVETFSISFRDLPQFDEFEYSRKVADLLGSKRHEAVVDEDEFLRWLPKLAYHADDPNGDPVCFPVFYVSKLIRDSGVIMAQVGEGADELFCGYGTYMEFIRIWKKYWRSASKFFSLFKKMPYFLLDKLTDKNYAVLHKEFLRRLADGKPLFFGGANAFSAYDKQFLYSDDFKKEIETDRSDKIVETIYKKISGIKPDADFLQQMVFLELSIRLPELLLMRVDKMASANSIEARVPFLDRRLVEMAFSIPMEMKIKNNTTKYILKKAVRGIIPDEIIDRKKQGFGAPISQWLKPDSKISDKLLAIIRNSGLKDLGIFNYDYIEELISDHQNNRSENSFKIWNLITLSLWYERWIAK